MSLQSHNKGFIIHLTKILALAAWRRLFETAFRPSLGNEIHRNVKRCLNKENCIDNEEHKTTVLTAPTSRFDKCSFKPATRKYEL